MSNSFTSPPVLVDPARVTAGLTIRSEEASRLADMNNYTFATHGTPGTVGDCIIIVSPTKTCDCYGIMSLVGK